MKIRIKYFEESTKLKKIAKGNWIDVYANKDVFVKVNERAMIPLGFRVRITKRVGVTHLCSKKFNI